ncbi:proto-oncogene Mas [Microcaecilia unicolor]|uniref:Proto-oncogene Mas-like n=1 Tax=Microcaecilia unicolor TaxID=1415580 RepID=A0A6P7X6H8_9AMPH|nr:proto-oncogene Mas-like [Microcaecilia unicolor]
METSTVYPNITATGKLNQTGEVLDINRKLSVFACFSVLICLIGLVGNAVVFWILCFRIRRTSYTVYILNLAAADFIFLSCNAIFLLYLVYLMLHPHPSSANQYEFLSGLEIVRNFGFNAGMFLLTAISVERCLSVLYPFWHRLHRLKLQSAIVCAFLFALSCLVSLLDTLICSQAAYMEQTTQCMSIKIFIAILTFAIFIPLMIVSSLILVIVVQKATNQCHPSKLYIVIVVTVVVFLISAVPAQLLWIFFFFKVLSSNVNTFTLFLVIAFCNSVNSAANPFIYFFVGRKRRSDVQRSVHAALERVFTEDGESPGIENKTISSNTSITEMQS